MATRPIWRRHLRLALVSCPVALNSVRREAGNLHFHLINPKTKNRVRMITQDAETAREVPRRDLVKGCEFECDRYALLDEEDFAGARIDSSSTLVIDRFVDAAAIDPIWFDASYHLVPAGSAGAVVYAVLPEAIERSGHVGLSRVVLAQRERAAAIRPYETRLREATDAKLRGEGIAPAPEEEDRGNVIDLMAALKKSLGQGNAGEPARRNAS